VSAVALFRVFLFAGFDPSVFTKIQLIRFRFCVLISGHPGTKAQKIVPALATAVPFRPERR
jgi:hypothetical protein